MRVLVGYDGAKPLWSDSEPSRAPSSGVGGVAMGQFVPISHHHADGRATRKRKRLEELDARRADGRATPEEMQASRLRGNAAMQAAKAARR